MGLLTLRTLGARAMGEWRFPNRQRAVGRVEMNIGDWETAVPLLE
jgi:hypothetical protein